MNSELAQFKFCADGGTNRLYDAFEELPEKRELYIPDEIRGDLDSLRPEVRSYYAAKGVKITRIEDQDSHDFMKCVSLLKEKEAELGKTFDVIALPALGGRFDQTIASINMLYMMKNEVERRVILLSQENITILLDKGKHQIHCRPEFEGPTCGIMPIGAPAKITTRGLRWNLTDHPTHFGGMVSTSNLIADNLIEIETDSPLVWTIEIHVNE
ncbi:cAMP-dependent protein kinase subunit [Apophysomyces ossiformis]|uniref:cAMP-dependent protein kinase subunit n=1 Tax=Apophysomyces ossiformis TaxID=679940 RepID=A0A8H7BLY5_9FUNG|nr:cAMP-dependent protein kinase subunit [Apophysomyces ossiformis]